MFSDFFPSEPVMHSVPALCSLVWKWTNRNLKGYKSIMVVVQTTSRSAFIRKLKGWFRIERVTYVELSGCTNQESSLIRCILCAVIIKRTHNGEVMFERMFHLRKYWTDLKYYNGGRWGTLKVVEWLMCNDQFWSILYPKPKNNFIKFLKNRSLHTEFMHGMKFIAH
jgi:hypothetical protein